jgi:hypothetical protein
MSKVKLNYLTFDNLRIKEIVNIFIFLIYVNPSQAQSFLQAEGFQQWNIIHFEYDIDDFPASTWCYNLGTDTVLNEVEYIKLLKRRYDGENFEAAGFIRETNDSVIYMKIGEDTEFLLYDFGADQGDTVVAGSVVSYQGEISNIYPFEYVVDSAGLHEIDGQMRYHVFLHGPLTEEGNGYSFSWVWGIGCLEEGLLYNPNELVGRDAYELLCYYENEDLLFHNEDYQDCNYSSNTGVEDMNYRTRVSLFPNPLTNISKLDLSGIPEATSVRIFDITGREVIRFSEIDENLVLRAVDYQPGFYFLSVYSGLRVVESTRFVVK